MSIKLPLYSIEDEVEKIYINLPAILQIKFSTEDIKDILEIEQDFYLGASLPYTKLILFEFPYDINNEELYEYIFTNAKNVGITINLDELQEILKAELIHLTKTGELLWHLQCVYN